MASTLYTDYIATFVTANRNTTHIDHEKGTSPKLLVAVGCRLIVGKEKEAYYHA